MKKIFVLTVAVYLFGYGVSGDLVNSIDDFAVDIYQQADSGTSNLILSPLSIQMALSLALAGSQCLTAHKLTVGLRFGNETKQQVTNQFHTFLQSLQSVDKTAITLNIANKIYIQQSYQISNAFKAAACQYYSAVETINFGNPTGASNTINTWVEQQTNNKIQNLINPNMISANTRLVLVNAIYFKGLWKHKFDKKLTSKGTFYISDTSSEQIDMMFVKNKFIYGMIPSLGVTALELPYNNSDISLLILLPISRTELSLTEAKLNKLNLPALGMQMSMTDVNVQIPKFKIEFSISLQDTLTKLGMGIIFSNQANFGGMLASHQPLKVSSVIHKAFISVDEDGAEAAAATGVGIARPTVVERPPPPKKFIADHSFAFIIKKKDTALFIGRFEK